MKIVRKPGCYQGVCYETVCLKVKGYMVASCSVYQKDYGVFLRELIVFDEDDYRKGYASKIMNDIISKAEGVVKLQVLRDNLPALSMYKKYGFVEESRSKNLITMVLGAKK